MHTTGTSHVDDQGATVATAAAIALPEGEGEAGWIKLLPYGTVRGRDGRGPYTVRDADHGRRIVAATAAYQAGADAPIDYEHQTQRSAVNGQPAPAAGWIKDFEARPDGIYGRAEWTATAAALLDDKAYRYISPTFIHAPHAVDGDGTVLRIVGAGLTNLPNLDIPAIAHQDLAGHLGQGEPMHPDQYKRLRALLGLSDAVSDEALVTHCQQLADGAKAVAKLLGIDGGSPASLATAAQASVTALATVLGVQGEATIPALATAAQQLADKAKPMVGVSVDLTRYVPMDVHMATAGQLAVLQGQTAQTEATRAVDQAVADGKVTPAQRPWALSYASQDLGAFRAYVAAAPVLVTTAAQSSASTVPPGAATGAQALTAEELAVAGQLGLTAERYLKAKEAE